MKRAKEEEVKEFARWIYRKYKLTVPVDLMFLLKQLAIDLLICALPERVAGMTVPVKREFANGLILVNKNLILPRRRFTIAHEIYHCLKHPDDTYFSLMQSGDSFLLYNKERESDIFAAELLMPADKIKYIWYNDLFITIPELASIFQVSKQAMTIRLNELKLKPIRSLFNEVVG